MDAESPEVSKFNVLFLSKSTHSPPACYYRMQFMFYYHETQLSCMHARLLVHHLCELNGSELIWDNGIS